MVVVVSWVVVVAVVVVVGVGGGGSLYFNPKLPSSYLGPEKTIPNC